MRKDFYKYLYLTLSERRGLVVVIFAIVLSWSTPAIFSFFMEKETTDFSTFLAEIETFQESEEGTVFSKENYEPKVLPVKIRPFLFNPNTASEEVFLRLGLREKTAQTILNYRNKGGKFFKKEDFKKIYGLKSEEYEQLKNFIQIEKRKQKKLPIASNEIPQSYETPIINYTPFDPNSADEKTLLQNGIPKRVTNTILNYRNKGGTFRVKEDVKKIYGMTDELFAQVEPYIQILPVKKKTIVKASPERNEPKDVAREDKNIIIDINAASAEEWQKLRGIGPYFSKKITNYRDQLGGFYSIEQVSETYNLPDSTFQAIKSQLKISPIFSKINLNQATEEALKKHPYISWKQAKLIKGYRNMHGTFSSVNDLLKIQAFKKEWVEKVKPYLVL